MRAQRPLHLSTPWTPSSKSLSPASMSHFSGRFFLSTSHPSHSMDIWVERMFPAGCEYCESKARTWLGQTIRWCELGCKGRTFCCCCSEWVFSISLEPIKKKRSTSSIDHIIPRAWNMLHRTHTCVCDCAAARCFVDTILSRTVNLNSVVIVGSVAVVLSRASVSLWTSLWNSWLCLAVVSPLGRLWGTVCTVYTCYMS